MIRIATAANNAFANILDPKVCATGDRLPSVAKPALTTTLVKQASATFKPTNNSSEIMASPSPENAETDLKRSVSLFAPHRPSDHLQALVQSSLTTSRL
jgi:hypothetical protein